MIECVHNYTSTYARKRVKLGKKHWYEHVPKSVEASQGDKVFLLWNQQVRTDRTIPSNKPDIIRDNEKGTCMLIDVAIPGDRNVIKKEVEKSLKYKDLTKEIQRMFECKNKGDTSKSRGDRDCLKLIQKIREQHTRKTAILGTVHILREVLM